MRNQTSFRLTTTLKPNDMTAKTTTVINKVDEGGNKYYPNFVEETVVITNDDRTMMETTKASCNNGTLTFTKRGLSDDGSQRQIENRKLSWNPGSLCFVTIGAGDIIDTGDDLYWNGEQTFEGSATFNGMLTTNKGVQYPTFDSVSDLEAYTDAFPGMFAVVNASGELYRYNALTETWSVVTTNDPTYPEQASTSVIGTVRGATNTEFANGTATGSQGELLVATPAQIQTVAGKATTSVIGTVRGATDAEFEAGTGTGSSGELLFATPAQIKNAGLTIEHKGEEGTPRSISNVGESTVYSIEITKAGFITLSRREYFTTQSLSQSSTGQCNTVTLTGTASKVVLYDWTPGLYGTNGQIYRRNATYAVGPGTLTITNKINYALPSGGSTYISVEDYFYFG